jgi:WD40 repeat protein
MLTYGPPNGTIEVFSSSGVRQLTLRGPSPTGQVTGLARTALPIVAAFSPDGRWIASAANNAVDLWDARTGRLVKQLSAGTTTFISLAFSSDDRTLAAGDAASAYLWQIPSGVEIRELQHANTSVYGVIASPLIGVRLGFSPDGQTVATSGDLAMQAWNVQNGQSLFNVRAVVGDMAFNPPRLISADTGAVKLYVCDLCGGREQLLATAARDTTRELTPGERALYLHQGS